MLKGTALRLVRLVHVASAGVWLGALMAIVALHVWESAAPDAARFGLTLAAYHLHETVLFWAFVVTMVTALAFSSFSAWGFAQHRWIAAKWVLALLLFGVTLWLQSPAISGAVALADAGLAELHGLRQADFRRESLTIAAIQLGLVAVVFVISTLRPWGRVVRRWNVSRRLVLGLVGLACCIGLAMAVMINVNLHRLRTLPIPAVSPSRVADGTHRGEAPCDIRYAVDVRVADGRVTAIDVRRNRTSHYARLAEAVTPRIVERQTPEVDAITGATTTSRCLMRAVAESLRAAERRP